MKMLSFFLVLLLGVFMTAGDLSASDTEQNPHYIQVKNSGDLHAYFRYAPDRPIVISGHRGAGRSSVGHVQTERNTFVHHLFQDRKSVV